MAERADPFAGGDFDVSEFKPAKPAAKINPDDVRKVAEKASFTSREPVRSEQRDGEKHKRERRLHRTGRNAQFTCKADPAVVDDFYAISNAQDWVMGETLERAVAALKRELKREGGS